jgi:hypothetical protein
VDDVVSTFQIFETTYKYFDTQGNEVSKEVVVIPNAEAPSLSLYWGDYANGIASWSKNKENAFDFLVRLFTDPDIANLIQYGIEGQNYSLQNGVAYPVKRDRLPIFSSNFTNPIITYPSQWTALDKRAFINEYYLLCEPNMPGGFRFDPGSVLVEVAAIEGIMNGGVSSLVRLTEDDVEEAIARINSLLKDAGIERVLDEVNHQLEFWKLENIFP